MQHHRFRAAMCALATLALPGIAGAETLADALADAYAKNPRLGSARAQLRAIDETLAQAGAPYRLSASIDASTQWARQRFENASGVYMPNRSDGTTITLSASQLLYNGGRTAAQVSAAEAEVLGGREELRQIENDILFEVIDAYASVLRDQHIVAIRQRSVDAFGRQVEQSKARRRGGDLTLTDIGQAEAQFALSQVSLDQARFDLQSSRVRYAVVVGRNPGPLEPTPPLPLIPQNAEDAFRQAQVLSPALQQALLAERSASARVAAERAESLPVVSLNGGIGYSGPPELGGRDVGKVWNAGVNVRVPIMQGGIVKSRVRQAKAVREQVSFDAETTLRTVNQQVQNAWNQTVTAAIQLRSGEEAVRAASISSEGSRKEYREGFRSTFEVLNEEQRLLDASIIVEQARYRQISGQAQLLAAIGNLEAGKMMTAMPIYRPGDATKKRSKIDGSRLFEPVAKIFDATLKPSGTIKPGKPVQRARAPALQPHDLLNVETLKELKAATLQESLPTSQPSCMQPRC
ncbi:TolC family outer membrane protein [Sphingobium sp. KCTC 72723]|uniref:TolC family outer membrane protein n=1 Tax=Sphingobium sp. KCTC 72723 TaxID=2733867 RepID=UPI00165E421D|nr:TolC family outer membrane protein [Sphingobium sp. KCTC 72723]